MGGKRGRRSGSLSGGGEKGTSRRKNTFPIGFVASKHVQPRENLGAEAQVRQESILRTYRGTHVRVQRPHEPGSYFKTSPKFVEGYSSLACVEG
jgi:hypothetical protein